MFDLLGLVFGVILRLFRTHRSLLLENLILRQQLAVLKRKHPKARFNLFDKLFWVAARRFWSPWKDALFLLVPETITRWHRAGFRLYWTMLCKARKRGSGRRISHQIRNLIFQMVAGNPTWGAPRLHGDLLKLGFDIAERTVSRWLQRAPKNPEPAERWKVFLHNHRDFFTVPTLTFGVLYCFFIIGHGRRRILHFGLTPHPTSLWIGQQLREAFPYEVDHKYLIHDRDAKFVFEVFASVKSVGLESVRTSFRSPWQNGVAERWVGSCRRDLLDHVIALNEKD